MIQHFDNSALLTLAQTLVGTKVKTKTVLKALELICTEASFECALIYEVDYSNRLSLVEHYTSYPITFNKVLPIEKLTLQEQRDLACHEFFYIEQGQQNTPLETRLLEMHHAEMLVLAPAADEEQHICGFLVLFNISHKMPLCKEDKEFLSVMLSMIIRYVGSRMYQNRIKQNREVLENILENTGIDIYVNDYYNHDILYINESMAAPYGGRGMFEGHKCWQILFPGQSGPCEFCPKNKLLDSHGEPKEVYTWDYQRSFDGSWFRVFSSAFYWADHQLAHVVSSANITDNKRNEAIIENLANYDQLTKLPNRRMLLAECERRIDKATATEQGYLLFFDIDGFKSINDSLGHDAGDEFLIDLGDFFRSIPMLKDEVYRNGGDEFVAIIGGESVTKDNIRSLAYFIHQRFKKPWELKKGNIYCNTSIGVACFPEDGKIADTLIQKADMAMYRAKRSGGGGVCFGYQLNQDTGCDSLEQQVERSYDK